MEDEAEEVLTVGVLDLEKGKGVGFQGPVSGINEDAVGAKVTGESGGLGDGSIEKTVIERCVGVRAGIEVGDRKRSFVGAIWLHSTRSKRVRRHGAPLGATKEADCLVGVTVGTPLGASVLGGIVGAPLDEYK